MIPKEKGGENMVYLYRGERGGGKAQRGLPI